MKSFKIKNCKNVIIDTALIKGKKINFNIQKCKNVTLTGGNSDIDDDLDYMSDFNRYMDEYDDDYYYDDEYPDEEDDQEYSNLNRNKRDDLYLKTAFASAVRALFPNVSKEDFRNNVVKLDTETSLVFGADTTFVDFDKILDKIDEFEYATHEDIADIALLQKIHVSRMATNGIYLPGDIMQRLVIRFFARMKRAEENSENQERDEENGEEQTPADEFYEEILQLIRAELPDLKPETAVSIANNLLDLCIHPDVYWATLKSFNINPEDYNEPFVNESLENTANMLTAIVKKASVINTDIKNVRALLFTLDKKEMDNDDQTPNAPSANDTSDDVLIVLNTSKEYNTRKQDCIDVIVDLISRHGHISGETIVRPYINKIIDVIDLRALPCCERDLVPIDEYLRDDIVDPENPCTNLDDVINCVVEIFEVMYPREVFAKNPLLRDSLPRYIIALFNYENSEMPKTYLMELNNDLDQLLAQSATNAVAYILRMGLNKSGVRTIICNITNDLTRLNNAPRTKNDEFSGSHNFTLYTPDKITLISEIYHMIFPNIEYKNIIMIVRQKVESIDPNPEEENRATKKVSVINANKYETPEEYDAVYD